MSVLGLSPLSAAQASGHGAPPPPPPPPPPATTYTTGTWQGFQWHAQGELISIPTFTAPAGGARVLLVDAFLKGDEFDLLEGAVLLGGTSDVPEAPATTTDPDTAWADDTYSRGTSFVGAGSRSLTIRIRTSPHDPPGAAYYRIDLAA